MARIGGETPLVGAQNRITLETPAGTTEAAPVAQGDVYKIGGTAVDGSGYKAVATASGDDSATPVVLVQALHRSVKIEPAGFILLGNYHQIRRIRYKSGSAPTIGQSIEASSDLKTIVGKAFDGQSYVLYVDTGALEAEVLLP